MYCIINIKEECPGMICFIKEWCMHLPFFVIKRQGEKDRLERDTGIEK